MNINLKKHTRVFAGLILVIAAAAAVSPFVTASCSTQRPSRDEAAAVERLRVMTRGGVAPAESVASEIETQHAGTRAGALARLLRARIRFEAGDFAGAAALLDAGDIARHTALGDHALSMRAEALEKAGRRVEARAAYEELARQFPNSLRARGAQLRASQLAAEAGQAAAVPVFLRKLADADDPAALLLTARSYEQGGDTTRALAAYRRLYFYAPASAESAEAQTSIARLNSTTAPASAEEAISRADLLFNAKRYNDAATAYADAFGRYPSAADQRAQLRRAVASANARRIPDAISALNAIPSSSAEARAEAQHALALSYARAKQWDMARSTAEEMRRAFPQSPWTMRALVGSAQAARDAKNTADALYFGRAAVAAFPGRAEVAGSQFEIAWAAHDAKNFQESSRLLIEHLAEYADENTDNRGRAGYWAARDSERAGRLAEARALYEAMLARYDANWYGYLAKQRLETMNRNGQRPANDFSPDSAVARAVANLKPVTIAEETAGPDAAERIQKSDQLNAVGMDERAHAEVDAALSKAPSSPSLNLAKARIFRWRGDNLQAFNVLRKSYPDYSQMKVEEMSRDVWDIFYPLAHWEIIVQEARARSLDPYMVAGLIRQESVFNPRASSHANAYGLMQLLVPTGRMMAQSSGIDRSVTVESLYEPRLNIQLGTQYLRTNLDKFGRLEYVAAAYNAGPGRAVAWRASLPLEMDEWAEAIPFRETRGYVQGVVRNMLQYKRLYDEQGRFYPQVGSLANASTGAPQPPQAGNTTADGVRPRRVEADGDAPEEEK